VRGPAAGALLDRLKAGKHLDFVASRDPAVRVAAEAVGAQFLDMSTGSGRDLYTSLVTRSGAKDWILLMRDCAPAEETHKFLEDCVFNPGCVYERADGAGLFQFFNVRASALKDGGDLLAIARGYEAKKVITVATLEKARYRLTDAGMFYRRALKRVFWSRARVKWAVEKMRKPPAGPTPSLGDRAAE
jgi:hypothetical protein